MINDALKAASISYSYSVPYIASDGLYYSIKTKNFSDEVKKKRVKNEVVLDEIIQDEIIQDETPNIVIPTETTKSIKKRKPQDTTILQ
jgi:hypothetical protein